MINLAVELSIRSDRPSLHTTSKARRNSYAAYLLGSKWTILIIQELARGSRRFNQLHSHLGPISPRTLAERLRWLEGEGIITRTAYAEIPPRVEYALTPKGRGFEPVLRAIREYETEWGPA